MYSDNNPLSFFANAHPEILTKISNGEINAVQLAKIEMVNRGLGLDGQFIGFLESEKLHFPEGRNENNS